MSWENQDCSVCQCLVTNTHINWERIKKGWPVQRERRGKLISGTASVGKQDPSASGFNEKGPNGNLKSGSASNPQSSGSLERGVRSIPSLIRAVCEIHIPILFSNHKFCQRCVLGCEIFFFFFIPFANLIPRSKSSFPSRTSRSWDVLFAAGKLCCALCGVVRGWKGSPACRWPSEGEALGSGMGLLYCQSPSFGMC